jgi:hypothetical protein
MSIILNQGKTMKKAILALGLLSAFSAFAQTTPVGVCDSIRRYTSSQSNTTKCAEIISRNNFDPNVLTLVANMASSSPSEAVNALSAAANASFDISAVKSCNAVRMYTSSMTNVTNCIAVIANNIYTPEVALLAEKVASSSPSESVRVIQAASNGYFMPTAVDACNSVRTYTSSMTNVTNCVLAIKNKVFLNSAESMCKNIASSSPSEAVNCLSRSALDYVPAPIPRDVIISLQELRDLKRSLTKARNQIERGNTVQALQALGDALRTVETVEASNR